MVLKEHLLMKKQTAQERVTDLNLCILQDFCSVTEDFVCEQTGGCPFDYKSEGFDVVVDHASIQHLRNMASLANILLLCQQRV